MNPPRRAEISIEVRSNNQSINGGIYRIYIDDTLITERTWNLSTEYAINENISVIVPLGRHKFKLVPVNADPGSFFLHNFHLGGRLVHPVCKSLEFDFAVDASLPAVV
jgi:hypothetical protein